MVMIAVILSSSFVFTAERGAVFTAQFSLGFGAQISEASPSGMLMPCFVQFRGSN